MGKKILITQRLEEVSSYLETRECLDIRWSKLINSLGCNQVALPYESEPIDYINQKNVSGIILSGGDEPYSLSKSPLSKKRDLFEKAVVETGISMQIPIIGVCRGMQFIAELYGSSLEKVEGHVAKNHSLESVTNTKFSEQLELISEVNSYHNYSVTKLSDELKVLATDKNGNLEAITHKTLPILCIMWHPERDDPFSELNIELIKSHFNI